MNSKSYLLKIMLGSAALAGVGAIVVRRAASYPGVKLKKSIVVDRSAEELYRYWRNFENLPRFVTMLDSVEILDKNHSRWTVRAPAGLHLSWDAEITRDRENEMIGWKSIKGSSIDTSGYVRFERMSSGRGTLVRVALQYNTPAGKLGAMVASILGKRPGGHIDDALHRFKQLMETGDITDKGRAAVRLSTVARRLEFPKHAGPVDEASEESFPASDAPAWTGTMGTRH